MMFDRDPYRRPAPREVDPADEVTQVRRENVQRWIFEREIPWSVDELLERAAVVGDDQAAAEAMQAKYDARAASGGVSGVDGTLEESGRSSPGTSGQVIRPTAIAAASRRVSPRDPQLQQSSPEGDDDGDW